MSSNYKTKTNNDGTPYGKMTYPSRMTARNEITGEAIQSRATNQDAYASGWDRIFGKKEKDDTIPAIDNENVVLDSFLKNSEQ